MGRFTPFDATESLVIPRGTIYVCRGCGDEVKDGRFLYETIRDGKVVGLWACEGPDAEPDHVCGEVA